MIVKSLVTAATIVGLVCSTALAQATNPLVGTWKMNVAKSGSAFKSGVTKIEAVGEGVKFTVDMVAADGTASPSPTSRRTSRGSTAWTARSRMGASPSSTPPRSRRRDKPCTC